MVIAGLVIGAIAIVAAIAFGIWNIHLSIKELREQREIGEGIEKLASGTLKAIEKNGVGIEKLASGTLKAIEKNGAQTRRAIVAAHQSIKEELDK